MHLDDSIYINTFPLLSAPILDFEGFGRNLPKETWETKETKETTKHSRKENWNWKLTFFLNKKHFLQLLLMTFKSFLVILVYWLSCLPEVFLNIISLTNGSKMIPNPSQWTVEGFLQHTKGGRRKLFTTGEACLVHVKLWPALYCLWCLSFNRLVDIMNEPDPPSATPERTLVLSELRSTLGALGQSRLTPPKQSAGPKEELVFLRV